MFHPLVWVDDAHACHQFTIQESTLQLTRKMLPYNIVRSHSLNIVPTM